VSDPFSGFLSEIPELEAKSPADLIEYFVYYVQVIEQRNSVTAADVKALFASANIRPYSNISAYLSKHSGRTGPFIRQRVGYTLERNRLLALQATLRSGPARRETSYLLRGLLPRVVDTSERAFLQEAIDCYEIDARRAAVVLTWMLAVHHLCNYVLASHLADFNAALAKDQDKRIKIKQVAKIDDFSEIPEGKLIELLRASGVISNDVRKILDVKLGIRNSCAHPSAIAVSQLKVTEFISDLIENVVLKYV